MLYDKHGTGKSMAGRCVLRNFYALAGNHHEELKGLMVLSTATTTKAASSTGLSYVEILANLLLLNASSSSFRGWLHVVLEALDEPRNRVPSLLILDDFDLDNGGKNNNIQFIEYLYKSLNPPTRGRKKNIMVVVLTRNQRAANALCNLNGGCRVRPTKGFFYYYDTTRENDWIEKFLISVMKIRKPEHHHLTHPTWKGSRWTKDLLIKVLHYHLSDSEFSSLENNFDFVKEGMTPFSVIQEATSILSACRKASQPTSPRKRKKSEDCSFPPFE